MGDDGLLVVVAEMDDHVVGFEGPNKLHLPTRVARVILTGISRRTVGFQFPVNAALAELVGGLHPSLGVEGVLLHRIVRVLVDYDWRVAMHKPWSHEALQIHLLGCGERRTRRGAATQSEDEDE